MLRRVVFALSWFAWCGVVVAIVFPWRDLRDHTHWGKVAWLPFVSPPLKTVDIVGNILLYVPFGYLGSKNLRGGRRQLVVLGCAALLSLLTEASQLFSHYRFPSATDLTCNLLGCFTGLQLAGPVSRPLFKLPQETHS